MKTPNESYVNIGSTCAYSPISYTSDARLSKLVAITLDNTAIWNKRFQLTSNIASSARINIRLVRISVSL